MVVNIQALILQEKNLKLDHAGFQEQLEKQKKQVASST
jgi:hypothetical protein